jgi:hypothetical protein
MLTGVRRVKFRGEFADVNVSLAALRAPEQDRHRSDLISAEHSLSLAIPSVGMSLYAKPQIGLEFGPVIIVHVGPEKFQPLGIELLQSGGCSTLELWDGDLLRTRL